MYIQKKVVLKRILNVFRMGRRIWRYLQRKAAEMRKHRGNAQTKFAKLHGGLGLGTDKSSVGSKYEIFFEFEEALI
jgi:hypothetical protein